MSQRDNSSKKLIIRLSSLGDVVLATSVLECSALSQGADWVVSGEYGLLIKEHPRVRKVWSFDRRQGLPEWVGLGRALWAAGYEEVLDLHGSLRARILKLLFRWWSLKDGRPFPRWSTVSKQRFRLYGYFLFRALWPAGFRPRPLAERFAKQAGGGGAERPDLSHLKSAPGEAGLEPGRYLCVMPGSLWRGKRWPVSRYVQVLRELPWLPVVLGTERDLESVELVSELGRAGVKHVSGVGRWDLSQVARVLGSSAGLLGNDTGLAHLAEAVGVPAYVVFGPTVPEMGFGPWRKESAGMGASLWCRPCGKDGRYCFRVSRRYLCLERLEPRKVSQQILLRGGHREESHGGP